MPQAPASRAATITRSSELGWSERPGRRGAMPTEARTPASTSVRNARRRWRGGAVPGSVVRQTSSSTVGTENVTETSARARGLGEQLGVADDQRAARDDVERVRCVAQRLDAGARQPVAPLGRLVRVGGGADRDRLAAPARAGRAPRGARSATFTFTRIDVP